MTVTSQSHTTVPAPSSSVANITETLQLHKLAPPFQKIILPTPGPAAGHWRLSATMTHNQ